MAESITVTDNRTGEIIEIPIVDGGISADELRKLLPGVWFYDPAFMTTAVASSSAKLAQKVSVVGVGPRARKKPFANHRADTPSLALFKWPVRIALALKFSQPAGSKPTRAATDLSV